MELLNNAFEKKLTCQRCNFSTTSLFTEYNTRNEQFYLNLPTRWCTINDKFICPKCKKELQKKITEFIKRIK